MTRGVLTERIAALVLAAALGVLVVPVVAGYRDDWHHTPPAWSIVVGLGLVAAFVAAVVALVSGGSSRWSALVLVTTVAGGLWTYPLVARETASEQPLVAAFVWTAAGACVLVSASWVVVGAAFAALLSGLLVAQQDVTWDASPTQSIGDAFFALTTLVVTASVWHSMRAVWERLRLAEASAVAAYRSARDTEATARRLARIDAFVHDEVLALLADVHPGSDDVRLRRTAAQVLDDTMRWSEVDLGEVALGPDLLDAVLEHYPLADTDFAIDEEALLVPTDVALAVVEAAAEALRNVARHAYPPTAPGPAAVVLRHEAAGLAVTISDAGRGFVARDRGTASLGITVSIERRLASVGGRGDVSSGPSGTTVVLTWPAT